MRSIRFLAQRLVYGFMVLIGLSVVIFLIARVVPGDPARMALGPRAPEEVVQRLREEMGLDKPLYTQYFMWAGGVLRGDLGKSLVTRRPVAQDIQEFLGATVELALFAGTFMATAGIAFGVLSAKYNNSWVDNTVRLLSYLGIVTPGFVFAVLFLLLFGYVWPILPTIGRLSAGIAPPVPITGLMTVDSLLEGKPAVFWDAIKHMVLPGVAMSMSGLAQQARITRSSMIDNVNKDYVLMARSQGISERKVFLKYLLKPSLIPSVSVLGLLFASLFGSAFLIELTFSWPGISRYCMNAMLAKDLNAISAVVLLLGFIVVIVNTVTDAIVSVLDPRIRLGQEQKSA
jgi:peptide/nickel transport system permease protein